MYKTYTCEQVLSLRGHNNKARSVAWTADDAELVLLFFLLVVVEIGIGYEFEVLE